MTFDSTTITKVGIGPIHGKDVSANNVCDSGSRRKLTEVHDIFHHYP